MVLAMLYLLAAAPLDGQGAAPAPVTVGVQVRAVASAEVIRVGRVGGPAGQEEVVAPLREEAAGRLIAEFR